ncbi:MAG: DUF2227 family putative metal-binding protein [Zetaproteobacteria bacterium]|nr:DUF2227 family putative metal-binding protein [Zetaproteobacteria bacterium]
MPSRQTHLKIHLFLSPLMFVTMPLLLQLSIKETLFWGLGLWASEHMLSPDLDLAHSKASQAWGPLQFLWKPYAKLFRHRGVSHTFVLGALTRILYLGMIGICCIAPFWLQWHNAAFSQNFFPLKWWGTCYLWFGLGVTCGNAVHIGADHFLSYSKKWRKELGRRWGWL